MSVPVTDRVVVDSHQRTLLVAIVINDKSLLWIHTIELYPNRPVLVLERIQELVSTAIDREICLDRDVVVLLVVLFAKLVNLFLDFCVLVLVFDRVPQHIALFKNSNVFRPVACNSVVCAVWIALVLTVLDIIISEIIALKFFQAVQLLGSVRPDIVF